MVYAELEIWAVESNVPYVGSFVESLWISEDLANGEISRLRLKTGRNDWTVEPWYIHDQPRVD